MSLIKPTDSLIKELSFEAAVVWDHDKQVYVAVPEKIKAQSETLRTALQNKIDIKETIEPPDFPIEWFKEHKEVLLDKSNDPEVFSVNDFLK